MKDPRDQLARWLLELSEYDFEVIHRPGSKHQNADGLSRQQCKQCKSKHEDLSANLVVGQIYPVNFGLSSRPIANVQKKKTKTVYHLLDAHGFVRILQENSNLDSDKFTINILEPYSRDTDGELEEITKFPVYGWTNEYLREEQLKDKVFKYLIEHIESTPDIKPDLNELDFPEARYWIRRYELLNVNNGVLQMKWLYPEKHSFRYRTILPRHLRKLALTELHDHPSAGHMGINKTWNRARLCPWYWPGMKKSIDLHIGICVQCQRHKVYGTKTRTPLMQRLSKATKPNERTCLDILGPLPECESTKNKYILCIVDYFSRWVECVALSDIKAETVAVAFERFMTREGSCENVYTDKGVQFESKVFKHLCKLKGMKKSSTCPFKPSSNGLVERFNKTVEEMLSCFVSEHQRDWDTYLPHVNFAYNSTTQASTGCTPFLLYKGREAIVGEEFCAGSPPDENPPTYADAALKLQKQSLIAHTFLRSHFDWALVRQKKRYELNVDYNILEKGDLVWMYRPNKQVGISPKLATFWDGPYIITTRFSDVIYECKKDQFSKPKIAHLTNLKKAFVDESPFSWFLDELKRDKVIHKSIQTEPAQTKENLVEAGEGIDGSKPDNKIDINKSAPEQSNDGETLDQSADSSSNKHVDKNSIAKNKDDVSRDQSTPNLVKRKVGRPKKVKKPPDPATSAEKPKQSRYGRLYRQARGCQLLKQLLTML